MQQQPDFWQDSSKAEEVGKKLRRLESKLEKLLDQKRLADDLHAMLEMLAEVDDCDLEKEFFQTYSNLSQSLDESKLELLLSGKYDSANAIVTIHAGAGGTEAQDWASMIYRMHSMFCDKMGFKTKVLDVLDGDEAGLKSITFSVVGENAYGYLKSEKGVHRLVRISPFDSNARRHTSFASVEVMPEIEKDADIVIRPEDLQVDTFRSSGAGGQHINKTESAIRITHIPSGIVVACQTERSQIQNRETAMKMLMSKLVEKRLSEEQEKLAEIRGEIKKIEWGSQIRSYVFCPYTMVKDHRTGFETSDVDGVMNGNLIGFINDYLAKTNAKTEAN